jgi:ketosteroid isomerase-like protein
MAALLVAIAQTSNAVNQLKKMEQDRANAVVKGDTDLLERTTANDYSFINQNGRKLSKSDAISAIKSGDTKLDTFDLSDLDVRVYGNTAVVTGRAAVKGKANGQDANGAVLFTRVYVKQKGEWKTVAYQQTRAAEQ